MSKLTPSQQSAVDLLNNGFEVTYSALADTFYCKSTGEYLTKSVKALIRKNIAEVKDGVVYLRKGGAA